MSKEILTDLIPSLKRCEVFVGLDDKNLKKLAALPSWQRNTYKEGEFIFQENVVANYFYVLEDGEVKLLIEIYTDGVDVVTQVPVDTITKGDIFGWSSLVTPHSMTMSAICTKPSSVLVIDGAELNDLMDNNYSLGYEIMKGLVRVIGARLRDLRGRFAGKERQSLYGNYNHID